MFYKEEKFLGLADYKNFTNLKNVRIQILLIFIL